MDKDLRSPAIQLLDLVWASSCGATPHAWERFNHALRNALTLAVGGGFTFAEGDIAHILGNYRAGYWIGDTHEWVYALAIEVGNDSAVKSYEAALGREPFRADDVDPGYRAGAGYLHRSGKRQRSRLAVGFEFPWKGLRVRVTSFAADSSYLTACSYRWEPEDHEYCGKCGSVTKSRRETLGKKFKITREDLAAERKRLKAEAKKVCGAKDGSHVCGLAVDATGRHRGAHVYEDEDEDGKLAWFNDNEPPEVSRG